MRVVQSLVDELNLKSSNVVFMGHSRGTELAMKMAAYNPVSIDYHKLSTIYSTQQISAAAMLVNPIGLRPHRALRPFWLVQTVARLWKSVPIVSWLIEHLLFWGERLLTLI